MTSEQGDFLLSYSRIIVRYWFRSFASFGLTTIFENSRRNSYKTVALPETLVNLGT